jgi:putative ABC transport system permease protein
MSHRRDPARRRAGTAAPPAGRSLASRLRRLATGPAGPGPAWALALVALLGAFVAVAGPREFTALQNDALQQTLRSAGSFGIVTGETFQIQSAAATDQLTAAQLQAVAAAVGSQIGAPLDAPPAARWGSLTTPFRPVLNPPPRAILGAPPAIEIAYASGLRHYSRLAFGSYPQAAVTTGHGSHAVVTVAAAVTAATAATLGLRPGTVIQLGRDPAALLSDPSVRLKVTGIVRPADPSAAFWTHDPSLAAPTQASIGKGAQIWQGGVFIGPAELPALETASTQGTLALGDVRAFWANPLDTRALTVSQVPSIIQAMTVLQGQLQETGLVVAGLPPGLGSPYISAEGVGNLTDFEAVQAAVGATDSLLTVGLFAVAVILLLVCALIVAVAYRAELALLRARGGSTVQVVLRTAARTAVVAGPALAAGALAAVLAIPGGANPASWRLLAAVAVVTLAAPALLVGWQHRGPRSLATSGRGDLVFYRSSARRRVAELCAIIAIAGGVAGLRARGLAPDTGVDPYISSAPVLVALAAGLIAAWVYPLPLRALLRLTASRRGTVGYLGIARAARARSDTLLPALALVVALAVIALGGMIRAAVSRGQVAASWQQVGADVVVKRTGFQTSIGPAAQRAMAAVPGVRAQAALFYVAPGSPLAGNLLIGTAGALPTGVLVADPASYAALVAATPWPAFPARLLARPGSGGAVPVIASPRVAAAARAGSDQLAFDSSQLTIHVAATAASTPAQPGGGDFIILPAWAAHRIQGGTAPNTVLLAGTGIKVPALRAALARTLPGFLLTSRSAVLQSTADVPSAQGSSRLFELSVAAGAACSVAAVLLGLALTGRDRTRLGAWLTALGLTDRQARRLALLDALPLLLVAVVGAELAGAVLGQLVGPTLDLSALTGSGASVQVQPDLPALILPVVALVALVAAITAGQATFTRRRSKTGVLRLDEGG